jgi:hypothetical protein
MLVSRGDLTIVLKRPALGSCIVGLLAGVLGSCGGSTASRAGGSGGSAGGGDTDGGTGGAAVDAATGDTSTDSGPFVRVLASFDPYADASPGLEGFALGTEDDPGNVGGGAGASLAWTGADGSPAAGALVCAAPFDGANQLIDVQKSYGAPFPQDWRGKVALTSWIKVASTPASGLALSVQVYAQSFSGSADGGASSTCPPDPAKCYLPASHPTDGGVAVYETCSSVTPVAAIGAWVQYRLDFSSCAAAFTPDTIVAFGVIVQSSAPNGDAGALDGSAAEVPLDMPVPDGGDLDADADTDANADPLEAGGNDAGAPPTSTVIVLDTFALE